MSEETRSSAESEGAAENAEAQESAIEGGAAESPATDQASGATAPSDEAVTTQVAEGEQPDGEESGEEAEEQPSNEVAGKADDSAALRWYAIHVYSGLEQKVLRNIQYRLEIEDMMDQVARVIVPTHKIIEIKDGKKVETVRNLMPGYALIQMTRNDEVFDMIGKLAGVAGFVGDGTNPIPMDDAEVDSLLAQTRSRQDKPKTEIQFSRGEQVKIIEGAFAGFTGQVDEIDTQRGKLSVMVSIFGRQTAVELDVLQIDKV